MLAVGKDVRFSDFVQNVEVLFEIEVKVVVVVVAKISATKLITS